MHVHIGGVEFVAYMLQLLIGLALWRTLAIWLAGRNPDSRIAAGLGAIVH